MKISFIRKYVTSVCIAAVLAGTTSSLQAADAASASIEINLDVIENVGKKTVVAPAKTEIAKPISTKKQAAAPSVKKTSKKLASPKSVTPKNVVPPPTTPAVVIPAPVSEIPPVTPSPDLPNIKDLPPELTPSTPPLSEIPVTTPPVNSQPEALPLPMPSPETPPTIPPKAEKGGLGEQLSDFINGKPDSATPPVVTVPPSLPSSVPPALESAPSLPSALPPAPNAMGTPLPDSKLDTSPPKAVKEPGGMNLDELPTLPTITKDSTALAVSPMNAVNPTDPVGSLAPPVFPAGDAPLLPTTPPTSSEVPVAPPPALFGDPKTSDLPTPSVPSGSLPPLEAISGGEPKATEGTDALPPTLSNMNNANSSGKTAELPDLVPLPENMKSDLPSLPSGNQQDLMNSETYSKPSSAKGTLAADLEEKANANEPDMRLVFNETETDVPPSLNGQLDTLAQKLAKLPNSRINIFSYAGGKKENGIYPKRVSLARGIAVRNYLTTNKGIDIERVNVRALGNKSESGPNERVDVFIIK